MFLLHCVASISMFERKSDYEESILCLRCGLINTKYIVT